MNNKGFTLIEIIIVIVILGILATLAVPRITGQMQSSRAAEAMQMFGALRRSATDCLQMSNGATTSCVTIGQLGVSIPTLANGASFTYTSEADSPAASQIQFKAVRAINGTNHAINMVITADASGNVTNVAYGVSPSDSPFAGIVNRANTASGSTAPACDTTALTNALNS